MNLYQSNSVITLRKEYYLSLKRSVLLTDECNVTVNSGELTGGTEYLTLYYEVSFKPMSL